MKMNVKVGSHTFRITDKSQDHWKSRKVRLDLVDADGSSRFVGEFGFYKNVDSDEFKSALDCIFQYAIGAVTVPEPTVSAKMVDNVENVDLTAQAAKLVAMAEAGQMRKAKQIAKTVGLPYDARGRGGNAGLIAKWEDRATAPAPQAATQAATAQAPNDPAADIASIVAAVLAQMNK